MKALSIKLKLLLDKQNWNLKKTRAIMIEVKIRLVFFKYLYWSIKIHVGHDVEIDCNDRKKFLSIFSKTFIQIRQKKSLIYHPMKKFLCK